MVQAKGDERKVAFVTGASAGIGAAAALELGRKGYEVAVSATRVENLSDTVGRLEALGARAVPVVLDLRLPHSIEQAMAQVLGVVGHVDVLVNNAGVTLRRSVLEVTPAEWDEVMNVNLKGTFFMSQQMGRHLVAARRPGCIISIASAHGMLGFPLRSTYGITKAGIIHMTRMLAYEWAEHGIRVNAIAPGTVDTPSRAAYFAANPDARRAMVDRVPLRRFATPEEVAGAVSYLASPQAEYITGQTLLLDGGLTSY
jgi:NAD(P)-dependent dehydrogenase (short-subunit alcohol dehydrogenase family)